MNAASGSSLSCNYRDDRRTQLPQSRVVESSPTSQASTTKFRPKNENLKRDIAIVLTLIFVLFKLSTHPMLATIGCIDPNAPQPLSQVDVLANIIKNMALKQYKQKIHKRMLFLEAVDRKKCYDLTFKIKAAEDIIVKSNNVSSKSRAKFRPGFKGTHDDIKRNSINRSNKKKTKKRFTRKSPVLSTDESPSWPPWASSSSSIIMYAFNPPRLEAKMKGSETITDENLPKQRSKKKLSFVR